MGFKDRVNRIIEIVKEKEEITIEELAYILNVSPTTARHLLKTASLIDTDVVYERGKARLLKHPITQGG
jgi:predicted DNA-binding transcriptional regulator YafY